MKESENTTRYSSTYCKHKVVGAYQGVFRPGYDSRSSTCPSILSLITHINHIKKVGVGKETSKMVDGDVIY